MDVDTTEESDGQSALRETEAREQALGARRGPPNASLQHFHDPVPVVDKTRRERWEFKCKYCRCSVRSFPRTVDASQSFEDEPILPKLNNLASHITECKKSNGPGNPPSDMSPTPQWNIKRSAELMGQYLKAGELNPEVIPTQKGFLRLFSAWILDESLPWTMGEAPSLHLLFKYLKIRFQLPSDTTVRNQLARIFLELHGKLRIECEIQNRICNRYMDHAADGLYICMHNRFIYQRRLGTYSTCCRLRGIGRQGTRRY
ncbi:hypothetical protein BC826DRAFT_1125437, partial [Russula brevipes]